jgi:hypothetical protein
VGDLVFEGLVEDVVGYCMADYCELVNKSLLGFSRLVLS